MKLTLQMKLVPTQEQAARLLITMKQYNAAASFASRTAFDAGVFSKPSIQKLCYYELRKRFDLSAQMAIRAIAKTADAYKSCGKGTCHRFKATGAMCYDERILSFKGCDVVSILTTGGRELIHFVFGKYQGERLDRIKGQVDLVYRNRRFYLYATIDMPEQSPIEVADFVGVDLGIVNLATDSTGESFSGEMVARNRRRRATARKQYQRKGTKSAKRRLKAMSGRQRRFQTAENHRISKRLVQKAKALGAGIALEDLTGIRHRIEPTAGRAFRRRFGNWSFHQLRLFVEYKARLEGVPVVTVNPLNSSRTCSNCGHCEKANRHNQATFRCKHCGLSMNADLNAALNLSAWAACSPAPKVAALRQ